MRIAVAALALMGLCSCRNQPPALVTEVTASQLGEWLRTRRALTLIDVRREEEWRTGHAAGAVHIPRWTLYGSVAAVAPDRNATVVLYCLAGKRSATAVQALQTLGYKNAFSLAGGFREYTRAGLPVEYPAGAH